MTVTTTDKTVDELELDLDLDIEVVVSSDGVDPKASFSYWQTCKGTTYCSGFSYCPGTCGPR